MPQGKLELFDSLGWTVRVCIRSPPSSASCWFEYAANTAFCEEMAMSWSSESMTLSTSAAVRMRRLVVSAVIVQEL